MKTIKLFSILLYINLPLMALTIDIDDLKKGHLKIHTINASKKLTQHFNIGFSNTTGNSNNLDFNTKYDFSSTLSSYKGKKLKLAFDTSYFLSKTNTIKSNEEYLANLGLEQELGETWLSYLSLNWLRNPEFKNYNHKIALGTGIGKSIFLNNQQSLTLKIGTSLNTDNYTNNQKNSYFTSLNEYIEYKNQLNKISKLYLTTGLLQNFQKLNNDYEALGIVGVTFKVGEKVNLNIEQEIAYDNLPPVGFKKTDTKSIVRLGYQF